MRLAPRALLSAALVLLLTIPAQMAAAQGDVVEEDFFPNACRDIDINTAVAHGYSNPLTVVLNGEPSEPFIETGVAQATQVGPGKSGDRVHFVNVSVPNEDNPIVTAQLLHGRVDLDVDGPESGMEAEAWVNTKVAHLNILDGAITADLIRGFAYARSDVRSARTYTDPSTIVNLQVRGIGEVDVSPGANITLPEAIFGPGSYITVYERIDHSHRPTEDNPFYEADVRVRMLHVHITEMLLLGQVEIIAAESYARAVSPTPFCGIAQSVEAAAYTARIREGVESPGILVGEQHIGVTGGSGHQQLLGVSLDLQIGGDVRVNVTETDVTGFIKPGHYSESNALSQIVGLCIRLDSSVPECLVELVVVKAEAHCRATPEGAVCNGEVEILKLVVDGVDVCASINMGETCQPKPDTRLDIGPIHVILNQHERVQEDGYASLYVRAIRIETPIPAVGTIIIGRAYASAGFENVGTNDETPAWDL